MKNLLFIIVLLSVNSAVAQKLQINKVSVGIMLSVFAEAPIPFDKKPFEVGYALTPSINLITSRTHHHIRYGTGNNSIQAINGYFLPKDWDVYSFFSKNLNDSGMYLGFGIEKAIVVNENLLFFPFVEVGTNFKEKKFLSFGVVINPSLKIWSR